jgi:chorismate synthase
MGGTFEVIAHDVPPGLGSHVHWDRKLDGRLAQALMSIPAIKAVGIGLGPAVANVPGSRVHDEIVASAPGTAPGAFPGVSRPTNNAGGLEGGVTNGEDLRVTAYMKPISTLMKPLRSVDLATMIESPAAIERSDVCAVPAAAVVGEAMVAIVLADALVEKFGGDSIEELWRTGRPSRAHGRAVHRALITDTTKTQNPQNSQSQKLHPSESHFHEIHVFRTATVVTRIARRAACRKER